VISATKDSAALETTGHTPPSEGQGGLQNATQAPQ
jgi:hypothetical protein